MDVLNTLIAAFGGAAAGVAIATFLGKQLVLEGFNKRLEAFKNELSNKSDQIRAELSVYTHQQNVELTRLDSQRSQAIIKLWLRFIEWNYAYEDLSSQTGRLAQARITDEDAPYRDKVLACRDKVVRLFRLSERLSKEVHLRAIYFDPNQYEPFLKCSDTISKLCSEFHRNLYGERQDNKTISSDAFVEGLVKACEHLQNELTASNDELRRTLLKEFRKANRTLEERRWGFETPDPA